MGTSSNAGATLSAVTRITSAPTFEEAAGSKPHVGRFRTSCESNFTMAFMSSNSPFTSCSSLHTAARALSPAFAFGRGPLEDDDRSQPDFPSVASSVSTSSCVRGRSKSAACERSNCGSMKNAETYQNQPQYDYVKSFCELYDYNKSYISLCDYVWSHVAQVNAKPNNITYKTRSHLPLGPP